MRYASKTRGIHNSSSSPNNPLGILVLSILQHTKLVHCYDFCTSYLLCLECFAPRSLPEWLLFGQSYLLKNQHLTEVLKQFSSLHISLLILCTILLLSVIFFPVCLLAHLTRIWDYESIDLLSRI